MRNGVKQKDVIIRELALGQNVRAASTLPLKITLPPRFLEINASD